MSITEYQLTYSLSVLCQVWPRCCVSITEYQLSCVVPGLAKVLCEYHGVPAPQNGCPALLLRVDDIVDVLTRDDDFWWEASIITSCKLTHLHTAVSAARSFDVARPHVWNGLSSAVTVDFVWCFIMRNSSQKRLDMARVNEGSHSFTCHPDVYLQVESTVPAFTAQPQSITTLWPILIYRPTEGGRLSWPGWLGEILKWFAHLKMVIHLSSSHGGWESD